MKYVKLNPNANIFHDAGTGLTVLKGQVKSVSEVQTRTGKIRNAIASGHLVYTEKPDGIGDEPGSVVNQAKVISKEEIEKMVEKFRKLVEDGLVVEKLAKAFNTDELKLIASDFEIEVEEGDTKADIAQAIMDEVAG